MSLFKIRIKAGTPATFDPTPLNANAGDSVFWSNDDKVAHWPAPNTNNQPAWLDFQVAPGGVSAQIGLNPPGPYTLNYICKLHPNETGQIKVRGPKKGAAGSKTVKGAYAGRTRKGALSVKTRKGALGGRTTKGAYAGRTRKGAVGGTTRKGAFGKNTR
jgi:hypothetical protein